jgi:hypothetical protein
MFKGFVAEVFKDWEPGGVHVVTLNGSTDVPCKHCPAIGFASKNLQTFANPMMICDLDSYFKALEGTVHPAYHYAFLVDLLWMLWGASIEELYMCGPTMLNAYMSNSQQGNVSGVQSLDAPNYGEQHLVSKFKAFLLMPWDPGGPKPLVRTISMKPTIMKASTRHSPAAKKQPFIGTLKSLANCSFSKVSPGQPSILDLWRDYIDIVLQVSHTAVSLEAFHLHSACTTCHVSISTMSDKFCDTGGMSCLGQIAETSSVLRFLLATDPSNHLLSGKESVLLFEDEACIVQNPFGIFLSDNTSVLLYPDESCDVQATGCIVCKEKCYVTTYHFSTQPNLDPIGQFQLPDSVRLLNDTRQANGESHGIYPSCVSLRHLSQNKCVTSRNQVYTCLLQVVYMSVELALLYAFLCNYGIVRRYMGKDLQYSLLTLRRLLVSMETSVAPKLQGINWIQQKESFGWKHKGNRCKLTRPNFHTMCVTRDTYNSLISMQERILHYMDTMVSMEDSGLVGEVARTAVKFGYDLTKGH